MGDDMTGLINIGLDIENEGDTYKLRDIITKLGFYEEEI